MHSSMHFVDSSVAGVIHTNLVGGYLELKRSLKDLHQSTISDYLNRKEIRWRFNPPYASHMGGIWERVIRSIKRVLSAICSAQALTDDVLLTLCCRSKAYRQLPTFNSGSPGSRGWCAVVT